jgi:hypothetical protein
MAVASFVAGSSRRRSCLVALLGAVLLAGCSGSSATTAPSSAPSAAPASVPASEPASAAASTEPSAMASEAASEAIPSASSDTSGPTAKPTAVDPCQLVTGDEAGALAGATFGPGKEDTSDNNIRTCVYSTSAATNQVTVTVAEAPDLATAQAAKAQVESEMSQAAGSGLTLTQLPDLADGGVLARASASIGGKTLSVAGIDALKGTIYFAVSNLVVGGKAASDDALKAQANTCLSRLP